MYCSEYHLCPTPECGGAKARAQQTCSTCTGARAVETQQQQQQQDNDENDDDEEDGDAHDCVNTGKSRAVHVIDEYIDASGIEC
eukprot:gene2844-29538_t